MANLTIRPMDNVPAGVQVHGDAQSHPSVTHEVQSTLERQGAPHFRADLLRRFSAYVDDGHLGRNVALGLEKLRHDFTKAKPEPSANYGVLAKLFWWVSELRSATGFPPSGQRKFNPPPQPITNAQTNPPGGTRS